MNFYKLLELRVTNLRKQGHWVIVCGDINISHRKIDHCDPQCDDFDETPSRQWMSHFVNEPYIENGSKSQDDPLYLCPLGTHCDPHRFVDAFRHLNPQRESAFTCWNTKLGCRERNYGTR